MHVKTEPPRGIPSKTPRKVTDFLIKSQTAAEWHRFIKSQPGLDMRHRVAGTPVNSKTDAVEINRVGGKIIMDDASLAANTEVEFQVNCSACVSNSLVVLNQESQEPDSNKFHIYLE